MAANDGPLDFSGSGGRAEGRRLGPKNVVISVAREGVRTALD